MPRSFYVPTVRSESALPPHRYPTCLPYVPRDLCSKLGPILARSKYAQNANLAGCLVGSCVGNHTIQNAIATDTRKFPNARVLAQGKKTWMIAQPVYGADYRFQKLPCGRSCPGLPKPSADIGEILPRAWRENQLARHGAEDSALASRRWRQFVVGPDTLDPSLDFGRVNVQPQFDLSVSRRHQISLPRPLVQILPRIHIPQVIRSTKPHQSHP